jgi:purine-nucleoside phosphorylase
VSVLDRLDETVAAIDARRGGPGNAATRPAVGLILGSGLGAFADTLGDLVKLPYSELPHLPTSRVVGHAGNLCFGTVGDVPVVCMQGRIHLYEGHSIAEVVHGARTMARLGVHTVLVTNAAGGLVPEWEAGDLMRVTDHLNLTGMNPLIGPNEDALGTRFPDMSQAYDAELGQALVSVAAAAGIALREGVYAALLGPTYETPAEVRMLRGLGAHAVGMSTVPEVIALRHMGVRVGALSCVTNLAAGLVSGAVLNHAEVEETARRKRDALLTLLDGWVRRAGSLPQMSRPAAP